MTPLTLFRDVGGSATVVLRQMGTFFLEVIKKSMDDWTLKWFEGIICGREIIAPRDIPRDTSLSELCGKLCTNYVQVCLAFHFILDFILLLSIYYIYKYIYSI